MKRFVFLPLLVFLGLQFGHGAATVFPQSEEDNAAIQQTVKTFYERDGAGDFDSAMKQISPSFYCVVNGQTLDYEHHAAFLKKSMERNSEKFINYSIYNIQTGNVSIKDGKATGVVDYDWGGSLVEGGKKEGGHLARSVHLAKEEDTWKITYIGPLVPETQ